MNYLDLPFISKVKKNQKLFGEKVIEIAKLLNVDPGYLMIVMNNESGLDSTAKNPTSSASGLIQFMDATAKALNTTTAELRAMANYDQLDYVYKYLKVYKNQLKSVADVYLAIFFPVALYKSDSYEFPSWVVKANKIFDINKDGKLFKSEFKKYVMDKYSKYLPKQTGTNLPIYTALFIISALFLWKYIK